MANDLCSLERSSLIFIGSKLDGRDRVRCRLVSKRWRGLLPFCKPPVLVYASDSGDQASNMRVFYVSFAWDERVNNLLFPNGLGGHIIGCTGKWLITSKSIENGNYRVIALQNVLSREEKQVRVLPLLPTHHLDFPINCPVKPRHQSDIFLAKMILSSKVVNQHTIVVGICGNCPTYLAVLPLRTYASLEMTAAWKFIDTKVNFIQDVIFHQHRLYGVNCQGVIIGLNVQEPHLIDSQSCGVKFDLIDSQSCGVKFEKHEIREHFLVEWKGELLMVVKFIRQHIFKIYKVDFTYGILSEVESLGNYALFLGSNTSTSVSVQGYSDLIPGCIYFTNRCTQLGYEVGVFHLWHGKMVPSHKGIGNVFASSPLMMEAWGIRFALQQALQKGWLKLVIESDCKLLIMFCQSKDLELK